MSSSSKEALPGVLGRLHAREAQRAAEAAARLESLQGSADPRESIEGFMEAFGKQRQVLEATLQALTAGGAGSEGRAALDSLAADISGLDSEVATAAYYLPMYDLRQATLAVAALKEQLEAARAALQPRKKFSFSRKAQATPWQLPPQQQQPGNGGHAGGGGGGAAPEGGAGEGAGEAGTTLQQLLGGAGGSSAPGRCISGLSGQVVVEQRGGVAGLHVTLSDLEDCAVFLLGPLAALFIHRLRGCRVYAGPVAGATFMEDVRDSTLMLAARQVRIHSTHATDIYLRVLSNPIIEHSEGVRFAPYTLAYPGLEQDLAQQGLQQESGKWSEVHDFGWLRAAKSPHWVVLPEEQRQQPPAIPEALSPES